MRIAGPEPKTAQPLPPTPGSTHNPSFAVRGQKRLFSSMSAQRSAPYFSSALQAPQAGMMQSHPVKKHYLVFSISTAGYRIIA
jgi:hypothetical protein